MGPYSPATGKCSPASHCPMIDLGLSHQLPIDPLGQQEHIALVAMADNEQEREFSEKTRVYWRSSIDEADEAAGEVGVETGTNGAAHLLQSLPN